MYTPTHPHIYTLRRTWLQTTFRSRTINQGNWQPCCAATQGLLISQPASVTTASALMSSALTLGRGGGGVGEQWVRDRETKYGEREREEEGRRNGVLPPLRHTHASQQQGEDGATLHPSLEENKTAFSIIEAPCIIKHNQSRADTLHVGVRRARCENRRTHQHLGQRPWLQWWRTELSLVSPNRA